MRSYLQKMIREIETDPVLRIYGALLAFLHVLSGIYWLHSGYAEYLPQEVEAICWPMWQNCQEWRFLNQEGVNIAIWIFSFFPVCAMALFAFKKKTGLAYASLIVLNLLKLIVLAFDFRLRMNHHIMTFWVTVAFLFFPNKRWSTRVLISLFYFWAGTLKFNSEWLSGSAIYSPIWFFQDPISLSAACIYVVVLEILLIWGLWAKNKFLRWATLIQLLIFHLFSFHVVGFYYPLLMCSLLAIYPLSWLFPESQEKQGSVFSFLRSREALTTVLIAGIFSMTQVFPKLLPGDSALTGEGRSLALHMFDSWTRCQVAAQIKYKDGSSKPVDMRTKLQIRLNCDPIVYLSKARSICREQRSNPNFKNLDWSLQSRRSNQEGFQPIVQLVDFCGKNVEYSFWSSNDWILK